MPVSMRPGETELTRPPRRPQVTAARAAARMTPRLAHAYARPLSSKRPAARSRKPSARGQLKDRIIGALMEAGKPGVTIKDMSEKLGTSYGNISVWFHTTAKGVREVKKVAPGRFAWMS